MIHGKKAIVTGASRGIGFSIAKRLAEQGVTVVITGRKAESLLEAQKAIGEHAIPLVWDVSNISLADEKIEEAARLMGGLDILVNNAGIFARRSEWNKHSLLETTPDEWRAVMSTNTDGLFFAMQGSVIFCQSN